jgi:hypothetical protein
MSALPYIQHAFRRACFLTVAFTLFAYGAGSRTLLTPWLSLHWIVHLVHFSVPLHKQVAFVGRPNPDSLVFQLVHGVSLGLAFMAVLVFCLVEFLLVGFNDAFYQQLSALDLAGLQIHGYFVPLILHAIETFLSFKVLRTHHNKSSWVSYTGVLVLRLLWTFSAPLLFLLAIELLSPTAFSLASVYGFAQPQKMTVVLSLAGVSLLSTVIFVAVFIRPGARGRAKRAAAAAAAASEADALLPASSIDFLDSDEELQRPIGGGLSQRVRSRVFEDDNDERRSTPLSSTVAIAVAAPAPVVAVAPRQSRAHLPAPVFPPANAADVPRLLAHEPTRTAVAMAKIAGDMSLIDDMTALLLSEDRQSFVLWVTALVNVEARAVEPAQLLREQSRAGRAVQEFVRLARPALIAPVVQAIRHFAASTSRFPATKPSDVGSAEVQRLKELLEAVVGGIVAAAKKLPKELLDLGREIEAAASAQFTAQVAAQALGTFAVVHVFGPVVVDPEKFGLEASAIQASNRANAVAALQLVRDALLLLAHGDDAAVNRDPVLRRLKSTFAESRNSMTLVVQTLAHGAPPSLIAEAPVRVPLDRLAGAMSSAFAFINANAVTIKASN